MRQQLHHILGDYGCFIIERAESEIDQSIFSSSSVHSRSPLALYANNIYMVSQLIRNDVSSTKVRLFLRKDMSVMYLTPRVVVQYIQEHGLYSLRNEVAAAESSSSSNTPPLSKTRSHTPSGDEAADRRSIRSSSQEDEESDVELMPV